jgi:TonB family protein
MYKKYFAVSIFSFLYILPAIAQDTTYYDAGWKVTTATNASYFRLKFKKAPGWQVRDCYLSGKVQMEGSYSDDSCKINQGEFSYYNEKSLRYHVCHYDQGKRDGIDQLYYENGQLRTEGKYKKGKEDGEWVGYYPSGKLSARAHFKEGDQRDGKFYNEDGSVNEAVTEFNKDNSFPGGSPGLQRFLIRNLKYPDSAVNRSIQGTVYVGFNVSKEGKIQNIHVTKSVEISLDQEALRVVGLMPDWDPLIIGGIYCDSYQVQPIMFALQDQ